jgi:uncharacterized protein YndB with AHSA1/START domain
MPEHADGGVVEREVRIAARPETIFPFLIDPHKMVRWQGTTATLDPRPGGVFRTVISAQNIASGAFVAIEPPYRVVYTFGWEGEGNPVPPSSSTVEITLTADGDGTILRLRHSGLPTEARDPHGVGWDHYLERLVIVGGGRDAGPDPWAG